MLYFAYERSAHLDTKRKPVPAWLPDHPFLGAAVPGTLVEVTEEALAELDQEDGKTRERVAVVVLTDDGQAHEAATHRGSHEPVIPPVFLYGTLMTGEVRHDLIEPHVLSAEPATVTGHLVQIDWYPGLVLGEDRAVQGELIRFRNVSEALPALDEYEDFEGYGVAGSLYQRVLLRARVGEETVLCWSYVYLGERHGLPIVESGDWRQRGS